MSKVGKMFKVGKMLYHATNENWFAGFSTIMFSSMTIGAGVEVYDQLCWKTGHESKMLYYDHKISPRSQNKLEVCFVVPLVACPFAFVWPVWLIGAPIGSAIYLMKK